MTARSELIDLSHLPHLRNLTIHAEMYSQYNDSDITIRTSYLPTAAKILKTASSLQQLTIEIYVDPSWTNLDTIDLSCLTVLTESSGRLHHIDLYIYTGSPQRRINHSIVVSLLAVHEGLMELIERGVLVVHPEETAPTLSRSYIAKENNNDTCIIM